MSDYHDIYDRVAKRCLTLSNWAVINFINGRFHTEHPVDSKLTYNWTEHADGNLKRTLADAIITVNDSFSYQIEFQMNVDGSIVMRAFEYGFYHAQKHQSAEDVLVFPEPVIIYLYESKNVPDVQAMTIRFGSRGDFEYRVPTLKYQELPQEDKKQKDLLLLLPFQLLKLRKKIEKERTKENMEALKNLVTHGIVEAIRTNEEAGNITDRDGRILRSLTLKLYHHIYDGFKEMEAEGVNEEVEDELILDIDIIEHRHEMELEAVRKEAARETEEKVESSRKEAKEAERNAENIRKEAEEKVEISRKETKALRMLLKGFSVAEAAEAAGLTGEEVEDLKNKDN